MLSLRGKVTRIAHFYCFLCLFFILKFNKGKTLGVARCPVSGNAHIRHIPAFGEHPFYPAVGNILGQKFLGKFERESVNMCKD